MIAIFNRNSLVCDIIRQIGGAELVTFDAQSDAETLTKETHDKWCLMLKSLPFVPDWDATAMQDYSASALSARQCELFDSVVKDGVSLKENKVAALEHGN